MERWLLRGLALAVLHAVAAVIAAKKAPTIGSDRPVLVSATFAVLIGIAVLWGALDGWRRSTSPYLTWTIASVVAGLVSGVLSVVGRSLFVDATGVSELGPAMTSGAAFVAMLVAVPAWVGVWFGSRLEAPDGARKAESTQDAEQPDDEATPQKNATKSQKNEPKSADDDAKPQPKPTPAPKPAPNPKPRPRARHKLKPRPRPKPSPKPKS